MGKKTKGQIERQVEQMETAEQLKDRQEHLRVAKEIESILEVNSYGLQPYIIEKRAGSMIFGFDPAVRLVKIPKDEPKANTEVGSASDEGKGEVSGPSQS